MKALVRDLKNDEWEVAYIVRHRKCIFFPFGDHEKWWSEAVSYKKYSHIEGTTTKLKKAAFLTEKEISWK